VQETGFLLLDLVFPGSQRQFDFSPLLLFGGFWVDSLGVTWVGSDGFMSFFVHGFQRFTVNAVLDVLRELFGVSFFIFFFQSVHVFSDVATENVFAVGLGIEVVFFVVVAWESLGGVWNIKTAIDSTFQGSEDFVTGGGSGKTGVQEASEWTWAIISWFDVVFVTIDFFLTFVELVKLHLGEKSSSEEKSSAVMSGVVGETDFDSKFRELVGVGGADNDVSGHSWVGNLADDIPVGCSDNQSVFWSVKFVLVLSAQSSSSLVVSFADLSSLEFWLESLEVSLVLLDFDQSVGSLLSSVSVFTGHVREVSLLYL